MFRNCVTSEFQESKQLTVNLDTEPVGLFYNFVNFLYIPDWKPSCNNGGDLILLSDLYALGEHLVAERFQEVVLRTFIGKYENI
jgi:hypothetical protein